MEKTTLPEFTLVGITLEKKTTNKNGQSAIDCGMLWQKFETGKYVERISDKSGEEIFAVYFDYEGDSSQPYSYFIGCKVKPGLEIPPGMSRLEIPADEYIKLSAKGEMPDCVADCWREIWNSPMDRAYHYDFEMYDERSKDWNNAEVDIFVSSPQ